MLEIKIQGNVEEIKTQLVALATSFGVVPTETEQPQKSKTKKVTKEEINEAKQETVEVDTSEKTLQFEKDIKPLVIELSRLSPENVRPLLSEFNVTRFSAVQGEQLNVLHQRLIQLLDDAR